MLHPELSTLGQVKQRFIDEGYLANRVGHPGAVSVLDDEVAEDGAVYLIMDLLDGETLEERMRRLGPMEPADVLPVVDALLDVLGAAHDRGIVHRDVKPDNIFLTADGAVKLLDFGIARFSEPGRPHTTRLGETMGTPAFMPPEQARGHWNAVDGRSDLWAVGATMFFAVSGQPVHFAETANEELLAAMTKNARSVATVVPSLPASFVQLVDKALAFEKVDRWPDARSMRAAIQKILETMPAPRVVVRSPTTGPPMVVSTSPTAFPTRSAWRSLDLLFAAGANRRKLLVGAGVSGALIIAILAGRRPAGRLPSSRAPEQVLEVITPASPRLGSPIPSPVIAREVGEPATPAAESDSPEPNASAPSAAHPVSPPRISSSVDPPPGRRPAAVMPAPRAKPRFDFDPLERRK
jgi:serine/threonine-protein kinase